MGLKRKYDRLAFTPTQRSRAYFDGLVKRLRQERGQLVRTTQREAFDVLVDYAKEGEAIVKAQERRTGT